MAITLQGAHAGALKVGVCAWMALLASGGAGPVSAQARSWETPVERATPRAGVATPSAPARSAPVRGQATAALYGLPQDRFSPRYGMVPEELLTQTLDAPTHPLSTVTLLYTPTSRFGAFGESATVEFETALRLFAFERVLAGDFEGFFRARLLSYVNSTGVDALPDVAGHLALDFAQSWRFVNGWSLELRGEPGIYSDLASPQFNCPATVRLHYAFSPELAGVVGATYRHGWYLPVFPSVGVAWQPNRFFRTEAMLPRSAVLLSPFRPVTLLGTIEWRNFDVALDEKPGLPDAFTVNEWLATAGLSVGLDEWNRLTVELGTYLQREIRADVQRHRTLSLSEEWLVRVGWHGAF